MNVHHGRGAPGGKGEENFLTDFRVQGGDGFDNGWRRRGREGALPYPRGDEKGCSGAVSKYASGTFLQETKGKKRGEGEFALIELMVRWWE